MSFTTLISTKDLAANLHDPSWVVVDCRFSLKDTSQGHTAYLESHIPGARYAHLDNDLSGEIIAGQTGRHPFPDVDVFAKTLGTWGIDASTQVVAYDDMGGAIAARLWIMLKWLGYEAVAVLNGGWQNWKAENCPVESEVSEVTPRSFVPSPKSALLADETTVSSAIEDAHIELIDARAAERYTGLNEPIDPIAGHIPSALNFPWSENLDEQKNFLPADQLKDRFKSLDTASSICYCGSGVTAAHNMLAMAYAGLPLPKLYPGSWSEWITSPHHIISTNPE